MNGSLCMIALMIAAAGISGQSIASANAKPVEVWCGGDDGLTTKVCDAAEQVFKAAPDLPLANKDLLLRYKIVIPTNVAWKEDGRRTEILYTVKVLRG
ncbi:MAG: hypothetical protein WB561_15825 [Terracidiphilus sp.]